MPNAHDVIVEVTELCRRLAPGVEPPHLHVSDILRSPEDLQRARRGEGNGYIRYPGHPDHRRVEEWFTQYENGAGFRVLAAGMGAITMAVFGALETKGPGLVVILPVYGQTYKFAEKLHKSPRHNVEITYLYANDPDLYEKLESAITERTAAVLFEIETNPTLDIPDIERIVDICRNHKQRPVVICDDTFWFGLCRPFLWGVDVVVGSGTKFLVGESSWPLGYCGVSSEFNARFPQFWQEANDWMNCFGSTPHPIETWITGVFCAPTLFERVKLHSINAMRVAQELSRHPLVECVRYPGLPDDPGHKLALKYLDAFDGKQYFGGVVSFFLAADTPEEVDAFVYHLTNGFCAYNQASLGGPFNMFEDPLELSHACYAPDTQRRCEIFKGLIRFSVGWRIDNADETIQAIDRSLVETVGRKRMR